MKRSLPTAGKRARHHTSPPPPPHERQDPGLPVISVTQATVSGAATKLAVDLSAALVREGLVVNALVAIDEPNADAQSALTQLAAAGVKHVSVVRIARDRSPAALAEALTHFPKDELLVVLGNAFAYVYRPFFCVVVNTPRTTHLPDAQALRARADLELSSIGENLVAELAKLLARRHKQADAVPG